MSKAISLERIDEILADKRLTRFEEDECGESHRVFSPEVSDFYILYGIKWWQNICYLYVGDGTFDGAGLQLPFDDMAVKSTWPNKAKTNLHLLRDGEVVCIIPYRVL